MNRITALVCGLALVAINAPSFARPAQQSQMAFDVASVKRNTSNAPPDSNFPLNSGDFYVANGGLLFATNWPLVTYIFFAYKLQGNQGLAVASQLPPWAMNERFDIQGRASGNPTKDEMRLMMRSLLADRFKLAVHIEKREVPVLAVVLAKPDKTGPQLKLHPPDAPCQTTFAPPLADSEKTGGLPTFADASAALCNTILGMPAGKPGRSKLVGRNVTIGFMADMFNQRVNLGRPMIDATGLTGTFDFELEFTPDSLSPAAPGANPSADPDGATFEQALRDQLGLKMESRKSSIDFIVLDHVERQADN